MQPIPSVIHAAYVLPFVGAVFAAKPLWSIGFLAAVSAALAVGILVARRGFRGRPAPRSVGRADLADLLGRPQSLLDTTAIAPYIRGQVVMVTGAGGSIGSELCRQIARIGPRRLLLFGHGENSLFEVEQELRTQHSFTDATIILADVADPARVRTALAKYRPSIIFHAAAHKHVPIIEANVSESVRNNVMGTRVIALAAAATGVSHFVMVSTDKAVDPTSILGATKRIAEMIVQSFEGKTPTQFIAVRFGNVLGSRGSVVRVFQAQIERGGPVTITHRDMERFFMTISEAASLILSAAAVGRDGEVCVLDMGRPVRIVDLAEQMIRAAGRAPYREIDIVETGIRPGEKLHEQLFTSEEELSSTTVDRVFIAKQQRIPYQLLAFMLRRLEQATQTDNTEEILHVISELVPSFVGTRSAAALKNTG